jgi:hypothetical protein
MIKKKNSFAQLHPFVKLMLNSNEVAIIFGLEENGNGQIIYEGNNVVPKWYLPCGVLNELVSI